MVVAAVKMTVCICERIAEQFARLAARTVAAKERPSSSRPPCAFEQPRVSA